MGTGSAAAGLQAGIGNVVVGSAFAFGQSLAANGAAAAVVGKAGIVAAGMSGTYVATNAMKEGECAEKDDGNTGKANDLSWNFKGRWFQ